jgi:triacylglycerol esterase/lipase EstA (alpha/beta hydrolase family)
MFRDRYGVLVVGGGYEKVGVVDVWIITEGWTRRGMKRTEARSSRSQRRVWVEDEKVLIGI